MLEAGQKVHAMKLYFSLIAGPAHTGTALFMSTSRQNFLHLIKQNKIM
jgi:hypothetical protein